MDDFGILKIYRYINLDFRNFKNDFCGYNIESKCFFQNQNFFADFLNVLWPSDILIWPFLDFFLLVDNPPTNVINDFLSDLFFEPQTTQNPYF